MIFVLGPLQVLEAASFTFTKIVDTSTPVPGGTGNFTSFSGAPSLDGGQVAFLGLGNSGQRGIYTNPGGVLGVVANTSTPIPDGTGNFTSFGSGPSLDGGQVAFLSFGNSGQRGIYSDLTGSLEKVIDLSDTLDGKTIFELSLFREGLSGDSLVFRTRFTDGSQGICTATLSSEPVVPEPTSLALFGVGLISAAGWQWRRRGRAKCSPTNLVIGRVDSH